MDEEWGPWIEHDGKGCPCVVRQRVEVQYRSGKLHQGGVNAAVVAASNWIWPKRNGRRAKIYDTDVMRYRIRKPKALRELIDMVENLPVKEDA